MVATLAPVHELCTLIETSTRCKNRRRILHDFNHLERKAKDLIVSGKAASVVAIVVLSTAFPVLADETYIQRVDPSIVCHNQDVVMSIWQSQSTVLSMDYRRTPAALIVDGRRWLRLPSNIQSSIALSAYCRVSVTDAARQLEVLNQEGNLLGVVSNGQWRNRLTGG